MLIFEERDQGVLTVRHVSKTGIEVCRIFMSIRRQFRTSALDGIGLPMMQEGTVGIASFYHQQATQAR